jgi:hypothetical protein
MALTWETFVANPTGASLPNGAPGNVQFYGVSQFDPSYTYTGTPVWGPFDGFGLSQIDGSPGANPSLLTDNSLWIWTTNLMYGVVQVANKKQGLASPHFQQQMTLMLSRTAGSPKYPNPVGGNCQFTWNGTGNNAYWNADWISLYNGGYYDTWTGTTWSYGSAYNPNYVPNVCSKKSYTM